MHRAGNIYNKQKVNAQIHSYTHTEWQQMLADIVLGAGQMTSNVESWTWLANDILLNVFTNLTNVIKSKIPFFLFLFFALLWALWCIFMQVATNYVRVQCFGVMWILLFRKTFSNYKAHAFAECSVIHSLQFVDKNETLNREIPIEKVFLS